MLEACDRIASYVAGLDAAALKSDRKTIDAVVRNLEAIGEAAKHVSDATRALAPTVPWRSIAGFRDVLIHDYFGVDLDIVCDAALAKAPSFAQRACCAAIGDGRRSVERHGARHRGAADRSS